MGALFDVVHDTITASKGRKESFDKSWDISDAAYQANAPRFTNFKRVRNNAIGLLKEHTKNILDARRECLSAPTVMKPSPQTPSIAHDEMEVDDASDPTKPTSSASPDAKMKMKKPSGLEDPAGELELIYSRIVVFNERFRDW